MAYDIAMNYEGLDEMDTILDKQIQEYCDSCNEFFQAVDLTSEYWKGTTAEDSISTIHEFRPKLEELMNLLETYRSVVKISESNHRETENENIQRARNMEF